MTYFHPETRVARQRPTERLAHYWPWIAPVFLALSIWYTVWSLSRPVNLQLSLELSSSAASTAQLFYDTGQGFNERDSRTMPVHALPAGSFEKLRFDFPAYRLFNLRFDPTDGPARIIIRHTELLAAGHTILRFSPGDLRPFNQIATRSESQGAVEFTTLPHATDPGLTLHLNESLSHRRLLKARGLLTSIPGDLPLFVLAALCFAAPRLNRTYAKGASFLSAKFPRASAYLNVDKLSLFLGLCTLLCGFAAAIYTALLVYRSYSPAIDWDQWEVVGALMRAQGHLTLSQVWAQHNEHRIPFDELACYADLRWFGGKNISLLIEIYFIQCAIVAVLAGTIARFGKLTRPAYLTSLGFVLFCGFYPAQFENFVRGFQLTFVLCIFGACLSFGSLVFYAQSTSNRSRWQVLALLTSLASAAVAQYSLAGGIVVWPVLVMLAWTLALSRKTTFLIAGSAVIASCLYFLRYQFPSAQTMTTDKMHHLFQILAYLRIYFGSAWDAGAPTQSWPNGWRLPTPSALRSLTEFLIFGGISLFLGYEFLRLRLQRRERVNAYLLANIAFAVGMATLTALGRVNLGLESAASSRYQSISLLFWGCLVSLMIVSSSQGRAVNKLFAPQLLVVFLMSIGISHFGSYRQIVNDRREALAKAYDSINHDPSQLEQLGVLYPGTSMIPRLYAYLFDHGGRIRPNAYGGTDGWTKLGCDSALCQSEVSGYDVVSPSACAGYVDSVTAVPGRANRIRASGWAWDFSDGKVPRHVLIVTATGEVVGEAQGGLARPDVAANIPFIPGRTTGWATTTERPVSGILRAFAVLTDGRSVCPLLGEYKAETRFEGSKVSAKDNK